MLAGLSRENKAKLNLGDATDYKYLTGGGSVICEGRDDAAEFADIRSAMKVLYVRNKRLLGQAFYVNTRRPDPDKYRDIDIPLHFRLLFQEEGTYQKKLQPFSR